MPPAEYGGTSWRRHRVDASGLFSTILQLSQEHISDERGVGNPPCIIETIKGTELEKSKPNTNMLVPAALALF